MMAMRILNFLFIAAVFLELQITEGKLKSLRADNVLQPGNPEGPGTRKFKKKHGDGNKGPGGSKENSKNNAKCEIKLLSVSQEMLNSKFESYEYAYLDKSFSRVITEDEESIGGSFEIDLPTKIPTSVSAGFDRSWKRMRDVELEFHDEGYTSKRENRDFNPGSTQYYAHFRTTITFKGESIGQHEKTVLLGSERKDDEPCDILDTKSKRKGLNCREYWSKIAWKWEDIEPNRPNDVYSFAFHMPVPFSGAFKAREYNKRSFPSVSLSPHSIVQAAADGILTAFVLEKHSGVFLYNYSYVTLPHAFKTDAIITDANPRLSEPVPIYPPWNIEVSADDGEFLNGFQLFSHGQQLQYKFWTVAGFDCNDNTDRIETLPSKTYTSLHVENFEDHKIAVWRGYGLRKFKLKVTPTARNGYTAYEIQYSFRQSPIKVAE